MHYCIESNIDKNVWTRYQSDEMYREQKVSVGFEKKNVDKIQSVRWESIVWTKIM